MAVNPIVSHSPLDQELRNSSSVATAKIKNRNWVAIQIHIAFEMLQNEFKLFGVTVDIFL
jgi:hypothetical protein